MQNTPQGSTPSSVPIASDTRLHDMLAAVANGSTIRAAIAAIFRSKADYYASVALIDRLFISRLAKRNVLQKRQDGKLSGRIKKSVSLDLERDQAVQKRTDQLSLSKGRVVTFNEYINTLIAADLRTINSN